MSLSRWQQSDLQAFLYRKYISERKAGTPEIKWIAAQLKDTEYGEKYGYSWQLIYKYLSGEENPPPEFFPSFFNVTRDIEVINWFISRCTCLPLYGGDNRNKNDGLNGSVLDETLGLNGLSGHMSTLLSNALKDNRIDEKERSAMTNTLLDIRSMADRAIEELKPVSPETGTRRTKTGFLVMSMGN